MIELATAAASTTTNTLGTRAATEVVGAVTSHYKTRFTLAHWPTSRQGSGDL